MAKRVFPPEWYASQAARRKTNKEGFSATKWRAGSKDSVFKKEPAAPKKTKYSSHGFDEKGVFGTKSETADAHTSRLAEKWTQEHKNILPEDICKRNSRN